MMWPYSSDEQVWLVPGKEWAATQPSKPAPLIPANENGAWPYTANDDVAEDKRPHDPQTFVGK